MSCRPYLSVFSRFVLRMYLLVVWAPAASVFLIHTGGQRSFTKTIIIDIKVVCMSIAQPCVVVSNTRESHYTRSWVHAPTLPPSGYYNPYFWKLHLSAPIYFVATSICWVFFAGAPACATLAVWTCPRGQFSVGIQYGCGVLFFVFIHQ